MVNAAQVAHDGGQRRGGDGFGQRAHEHGQQQAREDGVDLPLALGRRTACARRSCIGRASLLRRSAHNLLHAPGRSRLARLSPLRLPSRRTFAHAAPIRTAVFRRIPASMGKGAKRRGHARGRKADRQPPATVPSGCDAAGAWRGGAATRRKRSGNTNGYAAEAAGRDEAAGRGWGATRLSGRGGRAGRSGGRAPRSSPFAPARRRCATAACCRRTPRSS